MRLKQLLLDTKSSLEHPIYHPERTLNRHILLVTLRCWLKTNNMNVVIAGIMHDLAKTLGGSMVKTEAGSYWSHPKHAGYIADEIDDYGDLAHFIHNMGGDVKVVSDICRYHMGVKDGPTKRSKKVPFMSEFAICDDMVGRKDFGSVVIDKILLPGNKIPHRNAEITFCGQSPIQISSGSRDFTLTVNRTPNTYDFSVIPKIMKQFNEEISRTLEILV